MWNIFHDAFPIRTILCQRGLQIPSLSPFCHEGKEIISHFFLYCDFTRAVWLRSELSINASEFQQQPLKQWLQNCILSKQIMIWGQDALHASSLYNSVDPLASPKPTNPWRERAKPNWSLTNLEKFDMQVPNSICNRTREKPNRPTNT